VSPIGSTARAAGLRPRICTLAVTLVVAALFAPGAFAKGPDPRDQEIAVLKQRVLSLRQQAAVYRVEIEQLRQEMARLEAALTEAQAPRQETVGESSARVSIGRVEPPIETSDLVDVGGATSRDEAQAQSSPPSAADSPAASVANDATPSDATPSDATPSDATPSDATPSDATPSDATPSDATPSDATPSDRDLQAVYDQGYTLFHQKRYRDAEARFASFLARSPHSDLADNAQFWIGECRYARGEYANALSAFAAVVDRYPDGNKVPDAMVKAGKTLEATGDLEGARSTYLEVQARFPGTAAAVTAEERLAAMR